MLINGNFQKYSVAKLSRLRKSYGESQNSISK